MEPLVTPAEFEAGTGGAIKASDPRVLPLLSAASTAVRRWCGWHIAPVVTEELVLDSPGGSLIVLPTMRLLEVTALTVGGVVFDVESLEWSANGEVRTRDRRGWPEGFRNMSATIRHGFESAPDVAQVVQQVVANAVTSPLGATREQAGQVSIQWAQTAPGVAGGLSLLGRDLDVLAAYRLPGGA